MRRNSPPWEIPFINTSFRKYKNRLERTLKMSRKKRIICIVFFFVVVTFLLAGIILLGTPKPRPESLSETMRDAVMHETMKVDLFGLTVNPGLISAFTVTGIIGVFCLIIRIFVIPRFTEIPGKFQMFLETIVGLFRNLAKTNSPHKNDLLSAYIFSAGVYIFVGTIFELFGFQAVTTSGASVALPAPLSDINGAICMGCTSYLFILLGGLFNNGIKGLLGGLKEFSLPLSMSFRLFGALLSGALVTELVYYYMTLSIVLPVLVGVLFTLLHALIQAYVLTLLVSMFYGEVSEKAPPKEKKKKKQKNKESKDKDQSINNIITPEVSK